MENQHRSIKGYRELSQDEIDLMNDIKEHGESLRLLTERIKALPSTDKQWAKEGTIDLQKGIMSLVRSVAQPTTF